MGEPITYAAYILCNCINLLGSQTHRTCKYLQRLINFALSHITNHLKVVRLTLPSVFFILVG